MIIFNRNGDIQNQLNKKVDDDLYDYEVEIDD